MVNELSLLYFYFDAELWRDGDAEIFIFLISLDSALSL